MDEQLAQMHTDSRAETIRDAIRGLSLLRGLTAREQHIVRKLALSQAAHDSAAVAAAIAPLLDTYKLALLAPR